MTGGYPALEWNRKDKIDSHQSGSLPIKVPTNIRAAWAPAIVYKSKAITANSLEVSLNSDLMVYVALTQVGFQIDNSIFGNRIDYMPTGLSVITCI